MIDIGKPLKAKVYDADASWFDTSCLEVVVQQVVLPHPPYTKQAEIIYNGGRSKAFELLPQE